MEQEHTFIRPCNDIFFKRLMIDNPEILKHIIAEALSELGVKPENISDLKITNPEIPTEIQNLHSPRFDINTTLKISGENALSGVEMQVNVDSSYANRSAYYASKIEGNSLDKNSKYKSLKPVHSIHLLKQELFKNEKDWKNSYTFKNIKSGNVLSETASIYLHYIELPKLEKAIESKEVQIDDKQTGRLLLKFLNAETETEVKTMQQTQTNELLQNAINSIHIFNNNDTPERSAAYWMENARERDAIDRAAAFTRGKFEGKAEGKAEGYAIAKTEFTIKLAEQSNQLAEQSNQLAEQSNLIAELQKKLSFVSKDQQKTSDNNLNKPIISIENLSKIKENTPEKDGDKSVEPVQHDNNER